MKRQKLFLLASLAAAFTTIAWSVPASAADIISSNLGPGNTYGGPSTIPVGLTWGVNNINNAVPILGPLETAVAFTPSGNFTLTQVDVGILTVSLTNSVVLSVQGSNSMGLPDLTPLAEFTLPNLPNVTKCPFSTVECVIQSSQIVKPTAAVELLEGTQYWLVASPPSSPSNNAWIGNNTGVTAKFGDVAQIIHPPPDGFGFDGFGFSTPAFAVLGTPVGVSAPEPATLGLMVLGLLGAGFARRERRN